MAKVVRERGSRRTSRRPARASLLARHSGAAGITVAFLASRVAIHLAGVRFDARPMNYAGQVLSRVHLRDDLIESLAHLHSQPPLFNLFIGLGLRAPLSWENEVFHFSYLAFGLALALSFHAVLRRLGVGPKVAVALTLVFMLSPSVFLYENYLLYDYPVVLLLCLAVLAVQRYEDGHRMRDLALFLAALTALVLTRSMFHLVWLVAWVAVLAFHRRRAHWKKVAALAAVPLMAVVAVHANNRRVSGSFTSSSTLGISLAKITLSQLPRAERHALVARGQLSPVALVDPLSPVAAYREAVPPRRPTGVAVLDAEVKPDYANPPTEELFRPNDNNSTYIDVSNAYLGDALRIIRIRPGAYLQGIGTAYNLFFRPASDFAPLGENRERVAWLERFYNVVVCGVTSGGGGSRVFPTAETHYRQAPGRTAWLVVLSHAVALVGGAAAVWRGRRGDSRGTPPLALAFLWSTIAYITVVANLVEVGENNRFRLYTEPLVIALLAALVVARRRRLPQEDPVTAG